MDNKNDSATDLNYDPTNDRSMIKEREWNENTQTILFNQVEFLKQEIAVKNKLIERLLTELFEKNPESNNDLLSASTSTENLQSLYDLDNSRENILQAKSIIQDKSESPSPSPLTIHPNRYQVLDSNSNFEDGFEKANVVCKYPTEGITMESRRPTKGITESRRPSNVVNP